MRPAALRRDAGGGTAVLLDEAIGLVAQAPTRWVRRVGLASAPLWLLCLGGVAAPAVVPESADPSVTAAVLGGLFVAAAGWRGAGIGRCLRAAAEDAGELLPHRRSPAGAFLLGAATPGLLAATLPVPVLTPMVHGALAVVGALMALEGRGVADAALRAGRLTGGTLGRAVGLSVAHGLAVGGAWLGWLVGVQLLLAAFEHLLGLDVGPLRRLASPDDLRYLAALLVLGAATVEPVFVVAQALLVLQARASEGGRDLVVRWHAIRGPLAALLLLVPSTQAARAGPDDADGIDFQLGIGPAAVGDPAARVDAVLEPSDPAGARAALADTLEPIAADLRAAADGWTEGAVIGLQPVRDGLRDAAAWFADEEDTPYALQALGVGLPEAIATEASLRAARQVAGRIEVAVAGLRTPPSTPDPALRAALAAELSSADYRRTPRRGRREAPGWKAWLERLFAPAPRTWEPSGAPPPGRWVLAVLLIVFGAAIALVALRASGVLAPRAPEATADDPGALPDARSRTPRGWLDQAAALAADGRYRDAIRASYLASLASLDRRRVIDYHPARTNGEHLRSFRGPVPARAAFAAATRGFERAWYGAEPPDAAEWAAMAAACRPLIDDVAADEGA